MALNELNVVIGANIKGFERQIKSIERSIQRFSRNIQNIGKDLTASVSLPIIGLGTAAVSTFAKFDKLEKGLAAISGSADEGSRQMNNLLDVVKDVRTTIGLEEAARGSLQLQAVGIAAKDAENTLRQLAIAATLSGGSGEDVAEVARQLSQAAAKGDILQQELRIILERIPALAGVIKDEFGVVTAEALRDAGVSADEFIKRLTSAIERNDKFQNVQASLSKEIETFKINLQLAAAELGKSVAKALDLAGGLQKLSGAISRAVEFFSNLSDRAKQTIVQTALFAAAIGPVSLAIGKLSSLITFALIPLKALTSGFKLFVTGIIGLPGVLSKAVAAIRAFNLAAISGPLVALTAAAAAAVIVFNDLKTRIERANFVNKTLGDVSKKATELVIDERAKIAQLVRVIENDTYAKTERKKAIEELKRISPEYLGQLDAEKSTIQDVKKATDAYVESLLRAAKAQAAREKLVEIEKKLLDATQLAEDARLTTFQKISNAITSIGAPTLLASKNLNSFTNNLTGNISQLEKAREKLLEISGLIGAPTPIETTTTITPSVDPAAGEKVSDILGKIKTELQAVDSQAKLSGASFDALTPKLKILSDGLQKLFQAGLQPANPAIQAIKGQIDALRGSVETLDQIATTTTQNISGNLIAAFTGVGFKPVIEQIKSLNTESQLLGGSLAKLGADVQLFQVPLTATFEKAAAIRQRFEELAATVTNTLNNAFTSFAEVGIGGLFAAFAGAESFGNVFSSLFGLVADVLNNLGKAAIAAGIGVEAIKKALNSLTGVGAIIAGGALIALSKIIKARVAKSAPGLAEGGIVPPGFPNDTYLARLTSDEAVIPLDRLEQMMNGNAGAIRLFGQFEVRGSDLILALDRAKQEQFRIR